MANRYLAAAVSFRTHSPEYYPTRAWFSNMTVYSVLTSCHHMPDRRLGLPCACWRVRESVMLTKHGESAPSTPHGSVSTARQSPPASATGFLWSASAQRGHRPSRSRSYLRLISVLGSACVGEQSPMVCLFLLDWSVCLWVVVVIGRRWCLSCLRQQKRASKGVFMRGYPEVHGFVLLEDNTACTSASNSIK